MMTLPRRIEPEILDHLAADDPRAISARRGLKRLNAVTGHAGLMARTLIRYFPQTPPRVIVDLGAGDGTAMLRVARRLAQRWQNVTVILVDQQNIVGQETRDRFAALRWKVETVATDIFDFFTRLKPGSVDIVTANLFLHHFDQRLLTCLLGQIAQSTSLFAATEPVRTRFAREVSRMLWMIGCTKINCYDAVTSVRAGFTDAELSALWPEPVQWELHEHTAGLFLHCFVARRIEAAAAGPVG